MCVNYSIFSDEIQSPKGIKMPGNCEDFMKASI